MAEVYCANPGDGEKEGTGFSVIWIRAYKQLWKIRRHRNLEVMDHGGGLYARDRRRISSFRLCKESSFHRGGV
jgi:hypothetical protein